MDEKSSCCQMEHELGPTLRWEHLSLAGRRLAYVLFFLIYLCPAHAISTLTSYPWYVRVLLQWPWIVIGTSMIVPKFNRIPVNPHICGFIAFFISSIIVGATIGAINWGGRFPDLATAVAISVLASLMTGPMLRGYDKAVKDREARAEQSGESEPPPMLDLKS